MRRFRELVIRVEGVFDLRAALRIRLALRHLQPGGALRIDLTALREFPDYAVAALAEALRAPGVAARVVLSGLCQRQLRLLRYLGVDPEALAAGGLPATA